MQFMFITLALFRRQDAVGHVVIEKLAYIIFAKEVATAALMREAGPGIGLILPVLERLIKIVDQHPVVADQVHRARYGR